MGSAVPVLIYSVYFSCLIFKLTRKQRLVTEFLHSSHIQYDILCYSVILIAVLLGKDKIRTPHKPIVCSAHCIVSQPKIGMGEIICIFCLFRSIWIKLLCYDHTNNMTSGFHIFIAFLSNLSSSLFYFYETTNHLKVCENRDINVLFISGGKSCYHKVGFKVCYNELANKNFAMMAT